MNASPECGFRARFAVGGVSAARVSSKSARCSSVTSFGRSETTVGSSARKKVLAFGALGALGCLLGWLAGEGLLAVGRQVRGGEKEIPSLASRPTAVKSEPPKLE